MRVCSLDPGRIRDAFGMLVADVDESSIKLLNTREWYNKDFYLCLLYTSPSPRDRQKSRMPSSA